jgi:hypothetical protein
MSMRGAGWPAVLLVILLQGPSAAGEDAPPDSAAPPAPGACAGAGYLGCTGGCAPGKLIFLPCMAVGATRMAECRQRELAACRRACVRRHCS